MLTTTRSHDDNQRHVITVYAMRCLPPPITLFLQPRDLLDYQVGALIVSAHGAKGTYCLADCD